MTNRSTFGSAKVHSRHPSQDFMQNPNLQTLHSIDILGGAANSEQRRGSVHRAAESDQTVQNRSTRVGPKADGLVKETACADFVSKFEATDVGISRVKTADFDKPKIEAAGVEIAKVDEGNANEIHGSDAINGSKPQSVDDVNSGAVEQNRTLTDLIDPKKFDIGPQPGKKKMTKEDFLKPQSKKDLAVDSNDPFALLDPLRSMK